MAMRCFWPPESWVPLSPTLVLYFCKQGFVIMKSRTDKAVRKSLLAQNRITTFHIHKNVEVQKLRMG